MQQFCIVEGAGMQDRLPVETHGHRTPCDEVNPVPGLDQAGGQYLPDKTRASDEQRFSIHLRPYLTTA
jgi:hypothetical protein